jgi:xanthine dehydrogenase accessory factor
VIKEALHALADGQPRLLRLSREPPSDSRRGDGIVEYVMTCHSGGTLEIYVEPRLPSPVLWVVGTTPIAGALVELAAAAGFRVTLVDPIAEADAFPAAERVVATDDLGSLDPAAVPFVVVASQGGWDEEALEAALAREARYVGLVASPVRAEAVRAYLADAGVAPERLAALRAPAGLDIGAEMPAEVALSILAELVQVRRNRASFVAAPGPATVAPPVHDGGRAVAETRLAPAGEIVYHDPVCGMTVEPAFARHIAEHAGVVYAFCSVGCRTRFMRDPDAYVGAVSPTDAEAAP